MKDRKEILKLARQDIKKSWIKGELESKRSGEKKYCALGAIGKQSFEPTPSHDRMNYQDVDLGAAIALACVIDPQYKRRLEKKAYLTASGQMKPGFLGDTHSTVYQFNDDEATTQDDVKAKFDEAIEKIDELEPLIKEVLEHRSRWGMYE